VCLSLKWKFLLSWPRTDMALPAALLHCADGFRFCATRTPMSRFSFHGTFSSECLQSQTLSVLLFYRIKKSLEVEEATVDKDVEAEYKVRWRGFLGFLFFYKILLHLPPLRFHCSGGYWDRTPRLETFVKLSLRHWLPSLFSSWTELLNIFRKHLLKSCQRRKKSWTSPPHCWSIQTISS